MHRTAIKLAIEHYANTRTAEPACRPAGRVASASTRSLAGNVLSLTRCWPGQPGRGWPVDFAGARWPPIRLSPNGRSARHL